MLHQYKHRLLLTTITLFLITIWSCSHHVKNWKGGAVRKEGLYNYSGRNFNLNVTIENKLVLYSVTDDEENKIITEPENKIHFSDLHNWGFYLDKDMSLWVISSDMGHMIYKRDTVTGKYVRTNFKDYLTPRDVPEELAKALPDLIY